MVTETTTQQQCREFIDMVREVRFTKVRDRQVRKFNRLLHKHTSNGNMEMDEGQAINNNHNSVNNSQTQSHTCIDNNQLHSGSIGSIVSIISQDNKWVVNVSKSPLAPAQESLLSRGPNFALAPTNPPNVESISAVDSACQRLWNKMHKGSGKRLTTY